MINLINGLDFSVVAFVGIIFAFVLTCVAIAKLERFLPRDMGRAFAHEGKLSAGKPRGAGIIFVFTFAIAAVLFDGQFIVIQRYNRPRIIKILERQKQK